MIEEFFFVAVGQRVYAVLVCGKTGDSDCMYRFAHHDEGLNPLWSLGD